MDSLSEDAGIRIRGGLHSYKLAKQDTNGTNVLSFFFFRPFFLSHFFVESPSTYIAPPDSSSPYTYWSSEPSLEYLSHQSPSLAFCELR